MIGPHHTVPSIPSTASFHRARSFALIVRNALSNCLSLTLQECQQVRTLPIQRNGVLSCTRCLLKIGASIRFRGDREIDSIRISIPSWNQLAFPLSPPSTGCRVFRIARPDRTRSLISRRVRFRRSGYHRRHCALFHLVPATRPNDPRSNRTVPYTSVLLDNRGRLANGMERSESITLRGCLR